MSNLKDFSETGAAHVDTEPPKQPAFQEYAGRAMRVTHAELKLSRELDEEGKPRKYAEIVFLLKGDTSSHRCKTGAYGICKQVEALGKADFPFIARLVREDNNRLRWASLSMGIPGREIAALAGDHEAQVAELASLPVTDTPGN